MEGKKKQKFNWTEYYEDIVAFYFWEPWHLGKIKDPDSKYHSEEAVIARTSGLEVSLNHLMSLFFTIIPEVILNNIIDSIAGRKLHDNFIFDSKNLYQKLERLNDFTQPDLIFEGRKNIVAIELKIGAKSSLDQLMKYYLLNAIIQSKLKTKKKFILIYLGNKNFSEYWKEGYKNISELKSAFADFIIPRKTKKGNISIAPYKKRIKEDVKNGEIVFRSYSDLNKILIGVRGKIPRDKYNEGWINFIDGLTNELKQRKLD